MQKFTWLVTIVASTCVATMLLWMPNVAKGAPPDAVKSIDEQSVGAVITCFSMAPAGDIVALGSNDGQIRLWSLATNKLLRTIVTPDEKQYIGSVAFSPSGRQLAFHADDRPVRLLDLDKGVEVGSCLDDKEALPYADQICFSPDGKLVGIVSDSVGYLWNVEAGKTLKLEYAVNALTFSPDSKTTVLGFNSLRLVDAGSGRSLKEIGTITGRVTSMTFSSAGDRILTVDGACSGSAVRLVEVATGKESILGEKIRLEQVAAGYSPDGKLIAVSEQGNLATFWDASLGTKVGTLLGIQPRANSLAFTRDGQSLLTGNIGNGNAELRLSKLAGLVPFKEENQK